MRWIRSRDARDLALVDSLRQDVTYALRALYRTPGVSAVAMLSLAVGIAANTTIFSLINAVVIRPLPGVYQPDALVRLTNGSFSYPMFEELRSRQIFASTVAFTERRAPAGVNGTMQWAQVVLASGDYHSALGVQAMLGRTLSPDDDRAQASVAVLSHGFWMRAFAADPDVLGKTIRVNQLPVTIVGVTPREFAGVV